MSKLVKIFELLIIILLVVIVFPKNILAWKFAAYGDPRPGTNYDHSQNIYGILYKMPNDQRITVVSSGDLNKNGIDTVELPQWQAFRTIISPLGIPTDDSNWLNGSIPKYISSVGNHENNQTGWQVRWQTYLPAQANLSAYSDIPANSQGLYGSVKYNNALFVWLDFYSLQSAQETFIQNTLTRAKSDPSVMWKFVVFHAPPVACGGSHPDWSKGKTWHDSYFYPNGVDMIFLGDNHYYQRTCPFKGGLAASGTSEQSTCDASNSFYPITGLLKVNPTLNFGANGTHGVMHVVVGNGGAETGGGYTATAQCPWLESDYRVGSTHGFVEIEINGNTLHGIAWDTDTNMGTNPILTSTQVANLGKLDEFTIVHGNTGSTPPPSIKRGDLNSDGRVDIFDYNILIGDFGKTGSNGFIPADIDTNGKVDIFDFNILLGNFGK